MIWIDENGNICLCKIETYDYPHRVKLCNGYKFLAMPRVICGVLARDYGSRILDFEIGVNRSK